MRRSACLYLFLLLAACGKEHASESSLGLSLGCPDFESRYWDKLYEENELGATLPGTEALILELGPKLPPEFSEAFVARHEQVLQAARGLQPGLKLTELLVSLETGDTTTPQLRRIRDRMRPWREAMATALRGLELPCKRSDRPSAHSPAESPLYRQLKKLGPELFGLRKVLTLAYQSCGTLRLRAMRADDPDVEGVVVSGRHPLGGQKREIRSLKDLQRTHFYLQTAAERGENCHDIRAEPLIYDFGGKPKVSAEDHSYMDLFTNAGSGTKALGIDCSAYIFTALGVAGLKLDPELELKAIHVMNIPASRYLTPSDGLRCFKHVTFSGTSGLRPGDILATRSHVVMIDSLGSGDPFGVEALGRCEDIDPDRFDFVIAQSSPVKNGIGLDRIQARDYVKESESFKKGLTQLALADCNARRGKSSTPRAVGFAVIRHKKSSDCLSQTPLVLAKEACLERCPAL